MVLSIEGFKDYLILKCELAKGTADNYVSWLRNLKPHGFEEELKGISLLDYLIKEINNNPSPIFASELITRVIEGISSSSQFDANPADLRNRVSALKAFRGYTEELLDTEDEEDVIDSEEQDEAETSEEASTECIASSSQAPIIEPEPAIPSADNIEWYNVNEKYQSPFIAASQKTSVRDNFRLRIITQSRQGANSIAFPIKLIKGIFNKLGKGNTGLNLTGTQMVRFNDYHVRLSIAIDTIIDRTLFYVKDDSPNSKSQFSSRLPNGMWAYTLASMKALGVDAAGNLYIKLYRPTNNVRRVYSHNFSTNTWYPVSGVSALSQMDLDHDPTMDDILRHVKDDCPNLQAFNNLGLNKITKLGKGDWKKIIPLAEGLFKETMRILSFYNLDVLCEKNNLQKNRK